MNEHNLTPQERLSRCREERRLQSERNYRERSRERLGAIVETKIRTTMIGALAEAEEALEHLRGRAPTRGGQDEIDRVFYELRGRILNLGNAQIRAALAEVDEYDVSWNRHHFNPGMARDED